MINRCKLLAFAAGASLSLLGAANFAAADITGSVKLDGKAPEMAEIDMSAVKECKAQHQDPVYEVSVVVGEKGELKNVVVALKPDDPGALGGEVPKTPAVIDQKGCQYIPHVLAVMVGQEMLIKNDDPFLHNVHSQAQTNPNFNFGQPNKDDGKKVDSPKAAETYKVKCDVHPWMGAWVAVFEHPFFAVTGDDGKFTIKGNPPDGDYKVVAWHEKYGTQEGTVSVKDGKGEVNFTFKAEGAIGPDNPMTPKLAGTKTGAVKTVANVKEKSMSCCGSDCTEETAKPTGQMAASK
jgi:plastocyanin